MKSNLWIVLISCPINSTYVIKSLNILTSPILIRLVLSISWRIKYKKNLSFKLKVLVPSYPMVDPVEHGMDQGTWIQTATLKSKEEKKIKIKTKDISIIRKLFLSMTDLHWQKINSFSPMKNLGQRRFTFVSADRDISSGHLICINKIFHLH